MSGRLLAKLKGDGRLEEGWLEWKGVVVYGEWVNLVMHSSVAFDKSDLLNALLNVSVYVRVLGELKGAGWS